MNDRLCAEDTSPTAGKAYWGSGHALLLKKFYEEGEYFSPADAKNTMETVFAMYADAF